MGIVLVTIAVDSIMGGMEMLGILDLAPAGTDSPLTQATGS